jgi:hypothetical protein
MTNTTSGGGVVVSTKISPRFGTPSFASITTEEWLSLIINSVTVVVTSTANLVALCWFGMWMGMTSKNANLAALKTILFVQIVPYIVIGIGSSMTIGLLIAPFLSRLGSSSSAGFFVWYQLISTLVMAILFLAKDAVFIIWSRKVLYKSFRDYAVRSVSPPVLAIPPPIPAPPVIAAPAN